MAQIGTAVIVEGLTAPITTPTKTTTAGSLVVGIGATWHSASAAQTPNVTSSMAGTYSKASDKTQINAVTERIMYGITYNKGGSRGAGHTLSIASSPDTLSNKSGSFQEFDSIAATPTVTVGAEATGTSTAPSCSVTVPAGPNATVIGVMVYLGASTTATVASGTQISEADENSDQQAVFCAAKFGQAPGSVTITWTLAASRAWACYAVAFDETAANPVLVAATGSYIFSGKAAVTEKGSVLPAAVGAYNYTGIAAGLYKGFKASTTTGSYALTGIAASLVATRRLDAVTGAYLFTGIAANLAKGRTLVAPPGAYAFTGIAANLLKGGDLVAVRGQYIYTGNAALLERSRFITAAKGAYLFTGNDAALTKTAANVLAANTGAYVFSGIAATLTWSGAASSPDGSWIMWARRRHRR